MRLKSFLLDNQSIKQTVFKNTFWLFVGKGIGFLEYLLIIFVARELGPADYGRFAFALSVVSMFAAIAIFGLPEIVTREFSRREDLKEELPSILSFRSILSFGAFLIMFGASFLLTNDMSVRTVIWLLAAYALLRGFGETFFAVFRARQRMEYEAWMQALLTVSLCVFVGLALVFYPAITYISLGYLAGSVVAILGALVFFRLKIGEIRIGWNPAVWRKFFAFTWPLGLTAVCSAVYMFADSVIMGVLGQTTQVGWYNAAYRIANIILVPMTIISLSFYPVLSKYYEDSKENFRSVWIRFFKIMLIIATLLAGGVALFAPQIINVVYGADYVPAVLALRILMVMVWFWFLSTPLVRALVVANYQRTVLLIAVVNAVINMSLNLILIPRYSLNGAAAATAATYFVGFIIALVFASKRLGLTVRG